MNTQYQEILDALKAVKEELRIIDEKMAEQLEKEAKEFGEKLRVIAKTPPVTGRPFMKGVNEPKEGQRVYYMCSDGRVCTNGVYYGVNFHHVNAEDRAAREMTLDVAVLPRRVSKELRRFRAGHIRSQASLFQCVHTFPFRSASMSASVGLAAKYRNVSPYSVPTCCFAVYAP